MLWALAANLRARGYEVDLATTGEAALELATRHLPDVVILDLGLSGIRGLEVVQGLRGRADTPILILSARDAEADKIAALGAGADDYVTKPFWNGRALRQTPGGAASGHARPLSDGRPYQPSVAAALGSPCAHQASGCDLPRLLLHLSAPSWLYPPLTSIRSCGM